MRRIEVTSEKRGLREGMVKKGGTNLPPKTPRPQDTVPAMMPADNYNINIIRKRDVGPDDVIVITYSSHLSGADINRIREKWEEHFSTLHVKRIVVAIEGPSISILSPSKGDKE